MHRLQLPPSGLVLGTAPAGGPVAFRLLRADGATNVGVAGHRGVLDLLVIRLAAAGCHTTLVTKRPQRWAPLAVRIGAHVTDAVEGWPERAGGPPWALIIDMPEPPPVNFVRASWSTVVHFCGSVPSASPWWQAGQLLLTTRAHAQQVAALRPRVDLRAADTLAGDEALAVDRQSASVFVPRPDEREYRLLATLEGGGLAEPGADGPPPVG